jgi:hypothetical protein
MRIAQFERKSDIAGKSEHSPSMLEHWPVRSVPGRDGPASGIRLRTIRVCGLPSRFPQRQIRSRGLSQARRR